MNWLLLQQAADPAAFDWAQILGTGGPLAAGSVLVGWLAKIWVDSRKENREDKKADLEGEVGAVAAAREAVKLVREQMAELRGEIQTMKAAHELETAKLKARLESRDEQINKLEDRVRELESENGYLKGHRGASGGSGSFTN